MSRLATIITCHCLLALMFLLLIGCNRGPARAKVIGTVTYKKKPAVGATLMFLGAKGRPASANVDENGHYEAFSAELGDGVLLGEQTVVITPRFTGGPSNSSGRYSAGGAAKPETAWGWSEKYQSSLTSPLKIVVEPGKVNEFNFNLED